MMPNFERPAADTSETVDSAPPTAPAPLAGDGQTVTHGPAAPPGAPRAGARGPQPLPEVPGYEVLGVLGRGGMGVVYKARQLAPPRVVALKMVRSAEHASERELARFRDESAALARLTHPNIVQVYEVGEHAGMPYFSLEFCPGGSLADALAGAVPWPPARAARLIETLARAMGAAHHAGIVHRDLKPANVLLAGPWAGESDEAPPVKVTDFGLAKRTEDAGYTSTGAVMGTPAYMAPEQAEGKSKDVGPAADVYALGAMLYELLTGRPPFRGDTVLQTLQQVIGHEPPRPSRLEARVPAALEAVCLRCLEKRPHQRYATADALADDLRQFQLGAAVHARRAGQFARSLRWARRNPAVASLLAGVALCLAAGTVASTAMAVRASRQAARADAEALRAEDKAAAAELERAQADAARREAAGQLERAERTIYAMRVKEAQQALAARDYAAAGQALASCRWDCRGWEFHHLAAQLDPSRRHYKLLDAQQSAGSAVVSADGTRLAYGGDKGRTYWLDLTTGGWQAFHDHVGVVTGVALSPDGRTLASGSLSDGELELRTLTPPWAKRTIALPKPVDDVGALAFGPGGRWLAAAAGDCRLRAYDPETLKLLWQSEPFPEGPTDLAAAPGGGLGFLVGESLHLVDGATGKPLPVACPAAGVFRLAFDPAGGRVALAMADRTIQVCDLASGRRLLQLPAQPMLANAVAFDPARGWLLVAGADHAARAWDLRTGAEVRALWGHTHEVLAVARGPGGDLVTVGADQAARVWAAEEPPGAKSGPWAGHTQNVTDIAASPDGRLAATASKDGTARVWKAATGECVATLRGHAGEVNTARFDGAAARVLTAGDDGTLRLWDAATGACAWTSPPLGGPAWWADFDGGGAAYAQVYHEAGNRLVRLRPGTAAPPERLGGEALAKADIATVGLAPGGRRFALGARSGDILLWDCDVPAEARTLRGHGGAVLALAFLPEGQLASGSSDRTVRLWDLAAAAEVAALRGHRAAVRALARAPGGRLVSSGEDGAVVVWDAAAGADLLTITARGGAGVAHCDHLAALPDGTLLGDGADGALLAWKAPPAAVRRTGVHSADITACAALGAELLASADDQFVQLWDAATGRPREGAGGRLHAGKRVEHLAAFPGAPRLAVAARDCVQVWDVAAGRKLAQFDGGPAWRVAVSPDGRLIAAGGVADRPHGAQGTAGEVAVYDAQTGAVRHRWTGLGDSVRAVAFSPDSSLLAAGGTDGVARLWRLPDGALAGSWKVSGSWLKALAFRPDGLALAAGGDDRGVGLYEVPAGRPLWSAPPAAGGVTALAFRPDGALFAADLGGQVRLLDARTGAARRTGRFHAGQVWALALSPGGDTVYSAGTDRHAWAWSCEP